MSWKLVICTLIQGIHSLIKSDLILCILTYVGLYSAKKPRRMCNMYCRIEAEYVYLSVKHESV